eukprot:CAMPEP_0197629026 /NCGR_PEP_ID=MMETSP1338-20131121/7063_1 /TAXON_ID=43686 ORGANISM="Pelagodinium beii, Strain RCC1491" /NCGR_SAMPLE_ID=MMETSP1338 /ASSEMBLY_ACC=CAM_ASM_000754 /LENGTH=209 /DNA_ID=CAMNT_0043200033 /DNA_START=30 /DNA_END=660 /DNA_ORIENTATION=-
MGALCSHRKQPLKTVILPSDLPEPNALSRALLFDTFEELQRLVEEGIDVREPIYEVISFVRRPWGSNPKSNGAAEPPLVVAAKSMCSARTIELLLQNGASANASGASGLPPLHAMLRIPRLPLFRASPEHILLAKAKDEQRRYEIALCLLRWGADTKFEDESGETAMSVAKKYQHCRVAELLRVAKKDKSLYFSGDFGDGVNLKSAPSC